MQHNWFTTILVGLLAGALGAVGFGVAGAQNDGDSDGGGVTINVDQPTALAGDAAGAPGFPAGGELVCPGEGDGAGVGGHAVGAGGAGGGGAVAASANTNTLANGVVVENENSNANANANQQEQLQVLISLPFGGITPIDVLEE